MVKIVKSFTFNNCLKLTFWLLVVYVFVKVLYLDQIEELFHFGSELGAIIFDLALAYIGGFIFYWIANFQGKRVEKEKNHIINRKRVEELIYRSEQILYAYISLIGKRDKLKVPSDLTTLNFENEILKINVRSVNEHFTKIIGTDEDYMHECQKYYDLLIEDVTKLNNVIDRCIDNYHLMPLDLIKILQNYFEEYQLDNLLNHIKGLDEYYKIKGFPPEGYCISTKDNEDIRKEMEIIRTNLIKLKKYFENEFKNDYKTSFQIPNYDPRFDIVGFK